MLTPDLRQMCKDMTERGVTDAAMESAAVYWIPVWNELCESMDLKLVNPYFIKQLPGRKSDVKDAQWIAECQKELTALCERHFPEQYRRLQTFRYILSGCICSEL